MIVATIVGARPQFIKAAVLSRRLRERGCTELLVHTGQHYDDNMSETFFRELEIPKPDYHLGIGSGSHGTQTGRMLEAIEKLLIDRKPDRVVVLGDTNSTLAGALAASKLNIPVAHVEAGLRSHNRRMPEEINRVMADHLSDLLFAPTDDAVKNLKVEGIGSPNVHQVGDVMYDVALRYGDKAARESTILETLSLREGQYVLATLHRAENTDDPARLKNILEGLASAGDVVLPLHPRTKGAIEKQGLSVEKIRIIEPVGYLDMVRLESKARVIATDSGGVQKEAFFHRIPCVTLRDETEWVELVQSGWNTLCPPSSPKAIADAIRVAADRTGAELKCYGDGDAAGRIAAILGGIDPLRAHR